MAKRSKFKINKPQQSQSISNFINQFAHKNEGRNEEMKHIKISASRYIICYNKQKNNRMNE